MRFALILVVLACACLPSAAQLCWPGGSLPVAAGQSLSQPALVPTPGGWAVSALADGCLAVGQVGPEGALAWPLPALLAGSALHYALIPTPTGLLAAWTTGTQVGLQAVAADGQPGAPVTPVESRTGLARLGLAPDGDGYQLAWERNIHLLEALALDAALVSPSPLPVQVTTARTGGAAFLALPAGLVAAWKEPSGLSDALYASLLAAGGGWRTAVGSGSAIGSPLLAPEGEGGVWLAWQQLADQQPVLKVSRLAGGQPCWLQPASITGACPLAISSRAGRLAVLATTPTGLWAWCLQSDGVPAWGPVYLAEAATLGTACGSDDGWWFCWLAAGELQVMALDQAGAPRWAGPLSLGPGLGPAALAPARAGVVAAWVQPKEGAASLRVARASSDTTPPPPPQVTGPTSKYLGVAAGDQLSWAAEDDPESGTIGCLLAAGTTPAGADLVDWRPVDAAGSLLLAELALPEGAACYLSVRAKNGAGLLGEAASVGPYTVDSGPPQAALTIPSGALRGLVHISAEGTDPISGPADLQLSLDGQPVCSGDGSLSWDWDTRPLSVAEGAHQLSLRAADEAGNQAVVTQAVVVDNTTFDDVPKASPAWAAVEAVFRERITGGCSLRPPLFCPGAAVTREQMAVFLCRAGGLAPLAPALPTFADVPPTRSTWGYVEALVAAGVTSGCRSAGGLRYFCPTALVTREQMAVFLCRCAHLAPFANPTPTFADLGPASSSYPYVEGLYRAGVTGGCASLPVRLYCPTQPVTREQMARFLCRAFGITY